jgi:prepilin-type N-terminal cleavage/methylation domain-containing protein
MVAHSSFNLVNQPRDKQPEPGSASRTSSRAGFTLVEMMVAVVILAVGLLGLASTAAVVTRQIGGGTTQTLAANAIQSRTEWMRSLPCSKIKDSTATTRGVREHWVPRVTKNGVLWVVDTVKYSISGSKQSQTVQTYNMTVPCL